MWLSVSYLILKTSKEIDQPGISLHYHIQKQIELTLANIELSLLNSPIDIDKIIIQYRAIIQIHPKTNMVGV